MPVKFKGLLLFLPLILGLALLGNSISYQQPLAGSPLGFARSSHETLPSAPIGSAYPYDEQVGVTFTQNFSVLAFNVTAVPFTDSDGVGPGYLVNGLTNLGYWYQVGLSYNWPLTSGGVNNGFNMNYEVFDPNANSIFPSNGGGLQPFNGPVNAGDEVLLRLSFSSRYVVMYATDRQTGAVSSQSYPAYGNIFIGLTSSLAQSGFFTGLMTEQYHRNQYYDAGVPVTYNETGTILSSVWMWMDEWNTDTGQSVFRDNSTSPIQLNNSVASYFSSNGTAEVANVHGLVTGLTPVAFPILNASSVLTGSPGHQVSIPILIRAAEATTVRFPNLTITTDFGRYNFSLETSFTFSGGAAEYNVTVNVPRNTSLGNYNLTIDVLSWQYLDTQAQAWIALRSASLNETLVLTNNPTPSTNPRSNPPSSGQGPSTSTNKTTRSPISLLGTIASIIIPVVAGYVALVLLALVLFVRQDRKRSTNGPIPSLRFCHSCGTELSLGASFCHTCGFSTHTTTN
jgi:zinc ribbon protein